MANVETRTEPVLSLSQKQGLINALSGRSDLPIGEDGLPALASGTLVQRLTGLLRAEDQDRRQRMQERFNNLP